MSIMLNLIYIYIYIYNEKRLPFSSSITFINKKICRQKMSIMFNQICINEELLPKYTYIGGAYVVIVTIIGNGHGKQN